MARTRPTRLLRVIGLAGLVAVVTSGCSVNEVFGFGWPTGATEQAETMRSLWIGSVIAALVVGVIVWGLIGWASVAYRKRGDAIPRQTQYNLPLEIVYTVIPFVIVAVLFYFTAVAQNSVQAQAEDPDLRVGVTGFQWNWEFRYLGDEPTEEGSYDPLETESGEPITTVGTSTTIPILVVPTDRVVEYVIGSTDVIHSFWVPEFLFKRDVFPNPRENNSDNTFQTQIDREGAFVGRCAELCGVYHAFMNFEVRALPGDLFDRYFEIRQRTNPETDAPYTAGEALAELDCGDLCAPEATSTVPFDTGRGNREASASTN